MTEQNMHLLFIEKIEELQNEIDNLKVIPPDKITSSTYIAARYAAIQQVDITYYGQDFPERLRNLWTRLESEPEIVADEANNWLGSWHPEAMRITHETMLLVRKKSCLEQNEEECFVDVYGGVPVSRQISTEQEYLKASEATPDFCGRWREFKSREEAQIFIDNPNGVDENEDNSRIEITPDVFPIAFQSWQNGGIQTSSIYLSNRFYDNGESEYDAFVSKHKDSNTFATLHICNNLEEWIATDIELFGEDSVVVYGNVVNSVLNGWSFYKSDIYDTPIVATFSHFEECNDESRPDIQGWNVYTSDYGEVYIVSE